MASETIASASKQRGFLATPSYLRLWFAGGIGNAMRWLERLVAGIVWAMELAVRRRMIGEVVAFDQIGPAVAFDSLTNSIARVLGPLAGGAVFETLGLGGAYFLSAALYLAACLVVSGLDFRQESRKLRFGRIAIDIVEGLVVARANRAILAVVLVSIIMNMFAFSYSALIAPIGLDVYRVSPILVGALAAAEPLGAIAAGIALSARSE